MVAAKETWPTTANIRVPINDETTMLFRFYACWQRPLSNEELDRVNDGVIFPELEPGTNLPKANKFNDYMIDRESQRTNSFTGIKSIPIQDLAVVEGAGGGQGHVRRAVGVGEAEA